MLAVLEDAIATLGPQRDVRTRLRSDVLEAERWCFSDDTAHPFSFVNVCRTLNFEPDALRLGIAELRRDAERVRAFRRERRHSSGTRTRIVGTESVAEA